MRMRERQKIAVGDVGRIEKARRVRMLGVKQRDIVRPESMPQQFSKRAQQSGHNRGRAGRIWISRMADNTQNAIFRQRAGRPRLVPSRRKPGVCTVVLHVSRIDQSDQNVHVQQKTDHGSSSRNRCTNSDVTRCAPGRTLSNGTPFRVFDFVSAGDSARLANEEITSPTDFFSIADNSFAALSTSSSITSVVRICSLITHHTSDA